MEKVTSPIECYQYLQEAKPKRPDREPREKLVEVLKIYDKMIDILETTQIEMEIEGRLLMYNMTLPEVMDRLSEVLAEKMMLEEYLQQGGVTTTISQKDREMDHKARAQIERIGKEHPVDLSVHVPFDHDNKDKSYQEIVFGSTTYKVSRPDVEKRAIPGLSKNHVICVETAYSATLTEKHYWRAGQSVKWRDMMEEISCLKPPYTHVVEPYIWMFTGLVNSGFASQMFIYVETQGQLIGMRDVATTVTQNFEDSMLISLTNSYAIQCRGDASVKKIEIYQHNMDQNPVATLSVSINGTRRYVNGINHVTGFRTESKF